MIDSRRGEDFGVSRSAAADRGTIDRFPCRGRLRAQPRRAGADLPEWTLFDLAQHIGDGRRFWATIVVAGPADAPPAKTASEGATAAPREGEALLACCAGTAPWPHQPSAVDYHATEGRSWRLSLSADGARAARLSTPGTAADASLRGTASDLVLALYGRIPLDSLEPAGDRRIFDLLLAWEPDE